MRFVAAALAVLAGCGHDPMFSPDEMQPLVTAAQQRLAANRAAPVDAWIAPLLEGTSPAGACLARAPWSGDDAERDRCGDLLARELDEPATHVSPYQTGVRALPDLGAVGKLGPVLGLHLTRLADAGRGVEAARLAGDALALATTLARGHVPALVGMFGLALARQIANRISAVLDELPAEARVELIGRVDAALAALPPPAALVDGELEWSDARSLWLLSPDTVPPDFSYAPLDRTGTFGAPREEAGVILLANARVRAMWSAACGGSTTVERCAGALPARPPEPADFDEQRALYIDAVAAPTRDLREQLVASEARVTFGWLVTGVRVLASADADLAALRDRAAR